MLDQYRFGSSEVRAAERQVLIDGAPAALGARAFDLLLALIERRERVVDKAELFDAVWPGLIVEENNLQVQVSSLRKLLGPSAIATVPGRGYRFVAALEPDAAKNGSVGRDMAANPNNLPALLLLAGSYLDSAEAGSLAKCITYSQRAIVAAKAEDPSADHTRKVSAGVAHSTLGRAYAKQEKTAQAIAELKSATALLKNQDDQQYAIAGYALGWNYAKINRLSEARAILTDVAATPGPAQQVAKDLLTKVNTARAAGK